MILTLFSVLGLAIAIFATKLVYKPVGKVLNVFERHSEERYARSGRDEFAFIAEVASNIHEDNQKLKDMLNANQESLKHEFHIAL